MQDDVELWAASGAMWLTGRADGPGLPPPARLVPGLRAAADIIAELTQRLGRPVRVRPLELLAERAALRGLSRRGRISCGGGSELLRAADGWLALTLSRPEDLELLPAWVSRDLPPEGARELVRQLVAQSDVRPLVERGVVLGIPVAELPAEPPRAPRSEALDDLPVVATPVVDSAPVGALDGLRVLDLSSLWAGPLCTSILLEAGAEVVKVESLSRPDGARGGDPTFFDLVNGGKRAVALDFGMAADRALLARLAETADVVVEGSRPRALERLGVDATHMLAAGHPKVWLSITGHGRAGAGRERVGFGDDAAVAGGLAAWDAGEPVFCADAVADPCTGVVAAAAVLVALTTDRSWLVDASMAGVAASLSGPAALVPPDLVVRKPAARAPRARAPRLGQHTDAVLRDIDRLP